MSKPFDPFANQFNGGGPRDREDPIYRGDLEPELVARIQQLRCCAAQSSGNEEIFAGAVLALLGVIPPQVRYAVEDAENEATEKIAEVVAELRKTITDKEPPTDTDLVRIVRMIMAGEVLNLLRGNGGLGLRHHQRNKARHTRPPILHQQAHRPRLQPSPQRGTTNTHLPQTQYDSEG